VPLFHSNLALLPPLEISLIMIEEHYVAQGLSIVDTFMQTRGLMTLSSVVWLKTLVITFLAISLRHQFSW
jgi:hypothetical protein